MPGSRRLRSYPVALALLALATGCLDDSSSAPVERTGPASLLLSASADIGAAVDRDVGIRVYYMRGATPVDLPAAPARVRIAGGETRREAVTVQLAPCLADAAREDAATAGCRLEVELRLLDASGNTLDVAVSRPASVAIPGQAVEVPGIALAEVATVSIATVPTLRVQDARTLAATALSPAGQPIAGRTFVWSSSNAAVVSVGGAGAITAVAPGTATISATTGVRRGDVAVRVLARVGTVGVSPPSPTISAGATQQLTIAVRDVSGAPIDDLAERTLTWTSSAPAVASVDANGLVTGMRGGTAQISAAVDGVTGSATVTVIVAPLTVAPPSGAITVGRTAQLQAQGAVGAITWTSSDATVASVSAAGVVTAVHPGTATIGATTAGGQAASVLVTTQVQSTTVTRPTLESVSVGYSFALTNFTAFDADNQRITTVVPLWSVASGASALQVQQNGGVWTVTGLAPGAATLVARDARTGAVLRTDSYTVLRAVTGGNSALVINGNESGDDTTYTLGGRLLDLQGAPQPNRIVLLSTAPAGQSIVSVPARVRTDANGNLAIPVRVAALPAGVPSPFVVALSGAVEGDTRTASTQIYVYRFSFLDAPRTSPARGPTSSIQEPR